MTKVLTLLGTRPEIIRLSRVIAVLDETCDHLLVHTGQNYDDRLSGMFFRELGVRDPDVYMGVRGDGLRRPDRADARQGRGALRRREARHRPHPRRHEHRARRVRRQAHGHPRVPHGGRQPLLRRPGARRGQPARHRPLEQRAHALHVPQRREPRARGHRAPAHLRDRATRSKRCSTTTRRRSRRPTRSPSSASSRASTSS